MHRRVILINIEIPKPATNFPRKVQCYNISTMQPFTPQPPVQADRSARWLDRLGIGVSVACWIHCALLPALVLASPALSGLLLDDGDFHIWLLVLILPTAVIAFLFSWLRHRNTTTLIIGGCGLTLIVIASVQAGWFEHSLLSESMEKIQTSLGGLLLAMGHFRNLQLGRSKR